MNACIYALCDGLLDGGAQVVTNFPGFHSHELFSELGGMVTSVNETVAYEIAWGASLAGKRSVVTLKNVGLNQAADPFLNSMLVGVNGGLTVVVFDDVEVEGSQSRQDSRHYFDFFGGLWLEPYSIESAYLLAYRSLVLSERFDLPVIIRVTNQLLHQKASYTRLTKQADFDKVIQDQKKFVVHPINSKFQRVNLERKNKYVRLFVEQLYKESLAHLSQHGKGSLVVKFGACEREASKLISPEWAVLQIYTYPLPEIGLRKLLQSGQQIGVLEQGSHYGHEKIRSLLCGNQPIFHSSGIVPDHSNRYMTCSSYVKLFRALRQTDPGLVIGDLGQFTKDTLDSINACLCLGSSLSVATGVALAGARRTFVVTGDAAFLHSGKNVIPEITKRGLSLAVIVICNGGSRTTGGQEIPGKVVTHIRGAETYEIDYETTSEREMKRILARMAKHISLSFLFVHTNLGKAPSGLAGDRESSRAIASPWRSHMEGAQ